MEFSKMAVTRIQDKLRKIEVNKKLIKMELRQIHGNSKECNEMPTNLR